MYCMCLPAFFVAGADKSQLWVYTYVYAYCLRLFVGIDCLRLFTNLLCLLCVVDIPTFMATTANIMSLGSYR